MKRDRASELRAIADGRLLLNVRNGVTVSRSMLAMIADEIDAERAAHAETKRERDEAQADRCSHKDDDPACKLEAEFMRMVEKAEAQRDEALKALEPFAAVAEHDIGDDEADDDIFWPISNARYSMSGRLRVGHLRAARRALTGGRDD